MGSKAPSRVRIPLSPPRFRATPCQGLAQHAPVAQLDRAPGYELGGREFESLRARHYSRNGLTVGFPRRSSSAADRAVAALRALGPEAILLNGGHLDEGNTVVDRYDDGRTDARFIHDRIAVNGHGTGCTLASAIAANLCLGLSLSTACDAAIDYVFKALRGGQRPGRSDVVVLDHFGAARTH